MAEMGTHNFFLSPQSQFRNISAIAIPLLFKEMLLRNRNSAIAIFSKVHNFKSAT
jgi:hypothetical protein